MARLPAACKLWSAAAFLAAALACHGDPQQPPSPPAAPPTPTGIVKSLLDRQQKKLEDADRRTLERQYVADQAEGGQQPPGTSGDPTETEAPQ